MAQVPETLRATIRFIVRVSKPDWADAVLIVPGRKSLTGCLAPECFRPVIAWWPAKRSKYSAGEYYYSESWEPRVALIEEENLKWLEGRGLRFGWPYLAVMEGDRIAIYSVRERRSGKYTVVTPQERLLELPP